MNRKEMAVERHGSRKRQTRKSETPRPCRCPAGHDFAVTELVVRRGGPNGPIVRHLVPVPGGFASVLPNAAA